MSVLTIAGVCAGAGSAVAGAADQIIEGRDYISVLGGYVWPAKSLDTTGAGSSFAGIFGHQFATHSSVEVALQGSTFETGVNSGTDFYQYGATVDVTFSLWDRRADKWVTPFVLAGIGAVEDDFSPQNNTITFLTEFGVGAFSKPLYDGIRLRLDARYVRDSQQGGHAEPRLLAGIEIPLGRVQRHIEYLPAKTEIRTVEVVKQAPPAPPPPRVWVDSDGDGVDDEHDLCPNTPRGMKVDATGCIAVNQTFNLVGVTFETNKARLTPNAQTVLDTVTLAFTGQLSLKVEVAGHTDSVGSDTANIVLSQKRAEAVRAYLISKGALPGQLFAHGYGKTELLINPENGNGDRERNRRVELRVLAR